MKGGSNIEIKEFLEKLSNEISVSGYEHNITQLITDEFKYYTDEVTVDKLGNVIAEKKGGKKSKNIKVMIAAHMDEIGLIVKYIEDTGFIRFTQVGGFDPRTLLAQEVIVHGKEKLFGVIGAKPPHLQVPSERSKAINMDDLTIDVGFDKDTVCKLVEVGDIITIRRKFEQLHGDIVTGKALDDKAGIVTMYECAKELENLKHEANIYFVSTVQEEIGTRGAIVSTYKINPDIGIAIDVGFGATPELSKEDTIVLGEGPAITIGGNIHSGLREKLVEIAKEYNIPFQYEIAPGPTGTDAWSMQITRGGIPCLVISLPLRYMHTSVEVIDINDIKNTARLLARFISFITSQNLEELLCY